MRILISADMEGVTGVTWPADVLPGTRQWERCPAMFTSDVNTAVLGFFDGGADEVHALLQKARLVQDQSSPPGISDLLHDHVTDIVPQRIGIPQIVVQQPLHPLRTRVVGGLSQSPAVLPLRLAQQASQVGHHPPPRLHPPETPSEPRYEVTEQT